MAEPYTYSFGEIRLRVMKELRLPPNNADVQDQVLSVIGQVYKDICAKQDWWWLLKHYSTTTQTVYGPGAGGSITVSTQATGEIVPASTTYLEIQGTSPAVDLTNWVVLVPSLATDPSAVFRITGFNPAGANSSWFLDNFTGEDSTLYSPNTITVNVYQDSIPLPADVSKLLQVRRYGYWQPMVRVGIEDMMQIKEYDRSEGPPQIYSIYDSFFTGLSGISGAQRMLQIHPYPNHQYRLDLFYKEAQTTNLDVGTLPLIPSDYQQTLIYGALSRGYPIFLNDTERGAYYLTLFNNLMDLMSAQQKEYAKDQSGIRPDMMGYSRSNNRIRPRTSYTLGRYFDTLPNIP